MCEIGYEQIGCLFLDDWLFCRIKLYFLFHTEWRVNYSLKLINQIEVQIQRESIYFVIELQCAKIWKQYIKYLGFANF